MITVVLHNIRSIYNVGAILRTCEGLGIEEVVFSGYTPRYDNPELLPHLRAKLNRQIEKSALGAEKMVPQESVTDLPSWLDEKRGAGWTIVGLENNLSEAEQARQLMLNVASEKLGSKIILILGAEVQGIPADIRASCDYFLEIPMRGRKESFNVSVATAMALWELRRKD